MKRHLRSRLTLVLRLSIALLCAGGALSLGDAQADEPATHGGAPALRRMSETQYTRSIADIFGSEIKIPGRFEPALRDDGLLAIGASKAAVTPSGFEQYELRAREISAQILSSAHVATMMPCVPASQSKFDASCARQFYGKYGRLLLRRPLNREEMDGVLALTRLGFQQTGSFSKGLEGGLSRLLVSPLFIFRVEASDEPGARAPSLDSFALASRLSFLLWDSSPDETLLDAAARGDLRKPAYLWYVDAEVITAGVLANGRADGFSGSATGQFTTAFASFAKSGNPNHPGIPKWQPFTSASPMMMVFGLQTHESGPNGTLSILKEGR